MAPPVKNASEMPGRGSVKRNAVIGLAITAMIFVGVFALVGKHGSQRARVAEWATQHGFAVVGEIRSRMLLEPCPFLLNDEHDDILRAGLEDAEHRRRTAWFRFRLLGMEQSWE